MAIEKVYSVVLHVSEKRLGTLLDAIAGSATLISATATTEVIETRAVSTGDTHHYVNGKRNKGISGEDLILKTLASSNKVFTTVEIENAFVQHGFAGKSYSPPLSKLVGAGKVRALGNAKYILPGVTIRMGA